MPVIKLSGQKDIALEVKVTNLNGDDAYEASVVASFPSSLSYSALRFPPNVSLTPLCHTVSLSLTQTTICDHDQRLLLIPGACCSLFS